MSKSQSSITPLVSSLGCLAVAATTTLLSGTLSGGALTIAGTLLTGILGDLSINIASDQLLKLSPKMLRKSILAKSKDISNHDLQKSLQNSLKTALINCFDIYVKAFGNQKDKHHLNALEKKIKLVCDNIDKNFLEEIGMRVSDKEIIDFEEGIDQRVNQLLTDFLFDMDDFATHGKVFMPLLKEQLPLQITYAFTEELKDSPRCWIAYQRSLLQDLRADVNLIRKDSAVSNEKLELVIKQLDGLHQAGQQVDNNLLKTLIQTNVQVNELMSSSQDLMEGFIAEQKRRLDQLEQNVINEIRALMDITLTNQELLKKIHNCVLESKGESNFTDKREGNQSDEYGYLIQHVLPKYLNYMCEEYRLISLPNIKGNATKQTIPLDNIYIALQVVNDRTSKDFQVASQFIKKQITNAELNAHRNLTPYEKRQLEAEILEKNQTLRNFDYKDLKETSDQSISLAELFGKERYTVLLGDPGSGKSTIVKWLALHMASQFDPHNYENRLTVKSSQIYGVETQDDDQEVDLGPCRLPIVIKIPEYTQFFAKQKNSNERGIIDFCGLHFPTIPGVNPEDARKLISHFLASNNAVVFLDGMDEVVKDRDKILLEIRKFISYWINLGESDVNLLSPKVAGGNQILITSRIVGYHAAPLDEYIKEVYVRAMDDIAIKSFCQLWTRETSESQNEDDIQEDCKGLIDAIFDKNKPRIRELATNPLLITILALLYHSQGKSLPRNRTELYEESVNILMGKWTSLHKDIRPEYVQILIEEVASVIHGSPSEVIKESVLKDVLTQQLKQLNPDADLAENKVLAEAFIRIIRQDVGLLSERGHDLYQFLHRTFQEFLSARKLIRDPESAVSELLNKINDPIWREPVTMAIAYANASWSESRFNHFVDQLLNAKEGYAGLIPLGPILISATIPDMKKVNQSLIMQLLRRLLRALNNEDGFVGFEKVGLKVKNSINQLRSNENADLFYACCREIFKQQDYNQIQWSLLNLAGDEEWQSIDWLEDIYCHLEKDPQEFDFPVDRYLQLIFSTGKKHDDQSLLKLKSRLIRKPELAHKIKSDPHWLKLITVLYGGWPTHPKIKLYDELDDISKAFHGKTVEMQDTGYSYAVRLDTEKGLIKDIKTLPIGFSIDHIHRDSCFTRFILLCLQSGESASSLITVFEDVFKNSENQEERAQALLALAALNVNIHKLIAEDTIEVSDVYYRFKAHLKRVESVIHLAMNEFIKRSGESAYLRNQGWDEMEMSDLDVTLYGIMNLCASRNISPPLLIPGDPGKYIYQQEINLIDIGPTLYNSRFADALFTMTMTGLGDTKYKLAVILDTMGKKLNRDEGLHLREAVLHLPYSPLLNSKLNSSWVIPQVIIPAQDDRNKLINYLSIILGLSDDFRFFKEYFTQAVWNKLNEYPGLQELALCLFVDHSGPMSQKWIESILGQGFTQELIFKSVFQQQDPFIKFMMAYFVERTIQTVQMPLIMASCLSELDDENDQLIAVSCCQHMDLSSKLSYFNDVIQDQMSGLNVTLKSKAESDLVGELIFKLSNSEDALISTFALWLSINSDTQNIIPGQTIQFAKTLTNISSDIVKAYLINKYVNLQNASELLTEYSSIWEEIFEDKSYFNASINSSHVNINALTEKYPNIEFLSVLALSHMADYYVSEKHNFKVNELLVSKLVKEDFNAKDFEAFAFHGRNGIALNKDIVSLVDKLNKNGNLDKLNMLIPLLELNSEKQLHIIDHWKQSTNEKLRNIYFLILGENRVLNIDILEALINILIHEGDRLSRRAQIVLHGPNPVFSYDDQAFRTSELGYSYMLSHYKRRYDFQFDKPFVYSVLGWSHENWIDDSSEVIKAAVKAHAGAHGTNKKALEGLISCSNRLSPETFETVCQLLKTTNPETGKFLWITLSHVIRRGERKKNMYNFSAVDLMDILDSENAKQSLIEAEKLSEEMGRLGDLTQALLDHQPSNEDLNTQCELVRQKQLVRARINISPYLDDKETLWNQLIDLSKQGYYYKSTYETDAKKFLDQVGDNVDTLQILIKLTLQSLEDSPYDPSVRYISSNACYLLAAWAEERPEFVRHHFPEGNKVKRLLAEVICQHPGYIARSSAVKLIGGLNLMTKDILQSLINAITDLDEVSEPAVEVMVKFSDNLDEENLTVLNKIMDGTNAQASASIIKMFANISMNPTTSNTMRHRTLDILTHQLQEQKSNPGKNRFLYSYNDFTNYNKVLPFAQWKESLNEVIFSQLIRFSE